MRPIPSHQCMFYSRHGFEIDGYTSQEGRCSDAHYLSDPRASAGLLVEEEGVLEAVCHVCSCLGDVR